MNFTSSSGNPAIRNDIVKEPNKGDIPLMMLDITEVCVPGIGAMKRTPIYPPIIIDTMPRATGTNARRGLTGFGTSRSIARL